MFPARPLIRIDQNPCIDRLKGATDSDKFAMVDQIRIVGLIRQSECIAAYATEIFVDIANSTNAILKRVKNLAERQKSVAARLQPAIQQLRSVAQQTWPANTPEYVPISNESMDESLKEFEFKKSSGVNKLVKSAEPPPDFSRFAEITKGLDKEHPDQAVDFDVLYSNPEFVKIQYKQELIDSIREQQEAKRAEAKARKEKAKQENELLKAKNARGESKQEADEDLINALAYPPARPIGMVIPPPKGKAKHGEIPVSLQSLPPSSSPAPRYGGPSSVGYHSPSTSQPSANIAPPPPVKAGGAPPPPPPPPPPANMPPPPPPPPPPANLPPPPPPPAGLPPPPSGHPPPPPSKSTAELLKEGNVKLKKVEHKEAPPPMTAPLSHLDLIKQGGFKLKKVDQTAPKPPPKEEIENKDPNSLSLQEILQRAAAIRDAVAESDSDSDEDSNSSESETW